LAAIGGGFALARSHVSSAQQQLTTARSQLEQLRAAKANASPATRILTTPAVASQTPTWRSALQSALAGRVAWDDVLSQIGRVTPGNVTLTNLTLGNASSTATAAASSSAGALTISGNTFSEDAVAQLMARLQLIPNLSNISLTSSTADAKTGVVAFLITADTAIPVTSFTAPPSGAGA
jgi:Tfp pilus assembly protein PilN